MFTGSELHAKLYDKNVISDLRMKAEDVENVVFRVKRSHHLIKIPKIMNFEIAYLAGAIAGDGCFYYYKPKDRVFPKIKLVITSGDEKYLRLLNTIFIRNFGVGGRIRKEPEKQKCYDLFINHKLIWLYFRNVLGLDKRNLKVPSELANTHLFNFFLAGFFDTDGYCDSRGVFGVMVSGKSLSFLRQIVKYSHKFYDLTFVNPQVNVLVVRNKIFKRAYTRLKKDHTTKFISLVPLLNNKYGPVRDRTAGLRCVRATS